GSRDDLASGRRDRRQTLALAREELHSELGLELLQLLADPRLAREQTVGRRRDVQAAVGDTHEVLELLECHANEPFRTDEKAASSVRVGGLSGHITIC